MTGPELLAHHAVPWTSLASVTRGLGLDPKWSQQRKGSSMAVETLNPEEQRGRMESELDMAGAWAWLPR